MAKRKPVEPKALSIESLADLDNGQLASQFNGHLRDALLNCTDYPAIESPRKVTLEIELTPTADAQGQITGIEAAYSVKHATPKAKSRTIVMEVEETRDSRGIPLSRAYFNPASNEQHDPADAQR